LCQAGILHTWEAAPWQALWDLAIEGKLLEFWKGKVTEVVMPSHELGLFVGSQELDILRFFGKR
jgi:hypothetical protein